MRILNNHLAVQTRVSELLACGLPTKKVLQYVAEEGYKFVHENFENEAWMEIVPIDSNPKFKFIYEFAPSRELLTRWANCGSPVMSIEWEDVNQYHETHLTP